MIKVKTQSHVAMGAVLSAITVASSLLLLTASTSLAPSAALRALTPTSAGCYSLTGQPANVTDSTTGSCIVYQSGHSSVDSCWDEISNDDVNLGKCKEIKSFDTSGRLYKFCPGLYCVSAPVTYYWCTTATASCSSGTACPSGKKCYSSPSYSSPSASCSSNRAIDCAAGEQPVAPTVAFTYHYPSPTQIGQAVTLTAKVNNSASSYDFKWQFGDGAVDDYGGAAASLSQSSSHAYSANGSYNITVTAKSAIGTTYSASIPHTVGALPPSGTAAKYWCRQASTAVGNTAACVSTATEAAAAGVVAYDTAAACGANCLPIADMCTNLPGTGLPSGYVRNADGTCSAAKASYFYCQDPATCLSAETCPAGKKCYSSSADCNGRKSVDCQSSAAVKGCCTYQVKTRRWGILRGFYYVTEYRSGQMTRGECVSPTYLNPNFCGEYTACNGASCGASTWDVCPNLPDIQDKLPIGYSLDASGNCFPDVCANIPGIQEVIPTGYRAIDRICSLIDIGITVSGTVKRYQGAGFPGTGTNAIDGAIVSLFSQTNSNSSIASAKTAGGSFFVINNLPQAGSYGAKVTANGYQTVCSKVTAPTNAADFVMYPLSQPNNDPAYDCASARPEASKELQASLQCLTDRLSSSPAMAGYSIRFTSFTRCTNKVTSQSDCHDIGYAADFVPQKNGANDYTKATCGVFLQMANSCKLKMIDERTSVDYVNSCGSGDVGELGGHLHVAACGCTSGINGASASYSCASSPNYYNCEFR